MDYIEKRYLDQLMSEMTLEEKVGQLYQIVENNNEFGANIVDKDIEEAIECGNVGVILGQSGYDNVKKYQEIAVEKSRLGVPLLFNADVIHGYNTIFPIPLGLSCSFDLPLIKRVSRIIADEATENGVHWNNAPMLDVSRDPRWGRCTEGFGEDPYLGAQIARAQIEGFHGGSEDRYMMSCAKHFIGYGAAEGGRDYNLVDMSMQRLREIYLPPFEEAIEAGVDSIMPAFNLFNQVPCTIHDGLIKEILRGKLAFDGIVISDYGAVKELIEHRCAKDDRQAAFLAKQASLDIEMVSTCFLDNLPDLAREYPKLLDEVNQSVRRILSAKYRMGLFHDPYKYVINPEDLTDKQEMLNEVALEAAKHSIVLLENKVVDGDALLPLKREKSIALIGPYAEELQVEGAWAFVKDYTSMTSLRTGLMNYYTSDQLKVAKGCHMTLPGKEHFEEAIRVASESDIILLAVGESKEMSGEAKSYADLKLPGEQHQLVEAMVATEKPIVMILFNGRPILLNWYKDHVDALLECWFLGSQSGHAIAQVLVGEHNPSGKLTMSVPYSIGQIPIYYNKYSTGRPYKADPKDPYRSKYMDIPNDPLYPFGYGLSYTDFEYSELILDKEIMSKNECIMASVEVKNCGSMDGYEVVQLYISDHFAWGIARPEKQLKGFKKVFIAKGESLKVSFGIKGDMLGYLSADELLDTGFGIFSILIGRSSEQFKQAEFKLVSERGDKCEKVSHK